MFDGGLQLEIRQGDGNCRTLALDQSKSVRFGTSTLVEVVVSGKGIHRLHCGILWKNDHFELVASTAAKLVEFNGTQVGSATLSVGDRFRVGDAEVTVVALGVPGAQAELAAKAPAATTEGKRATKPVAQTKKPPAPLGKVGGSAAGSSSAALFDDDLSDVIDLADLSLNALSTATPEADAADPLAASAAIPAVVQYKSGRPGKATTGKTQGAGKKPSSPRETKIKGPGLLKSPRFWPAIAVLAALGLGTYGAVWYSRLPSADEMLSEAEQAYDSGGLGTAAEKFDAFLRRYPDHPRADVARARRALARLRPLADAGGNWRAALSTARETVPSAADLLGHPEDRRLLANVLSKIAKGLVDEAHVLAAEQSEAAQAAFDSAREAVALGRRWLPDRLRSATGLDQTELALARLERERDGARALDEAIGRIKAGDADQARRALLQEHPELAADTRLSTALSETAAAERDRVVFGPFQPPAPVNVDDLPSTHTSLAGAIGQTAPANSAVVVLAPFVACAYGIDAAGGRLLWRRFVGFDTSFVPRALDETPEGDLLLVDSTRSEVTRIKALTGETVWRTPLSEFDAEPVVAADQALVACRDGDLVAIDLANGAIRWKCLLPRPLRVGPAVDSARGLIYQLADEGRLFVLSELERKCIEVIYLGHEAGAIATPPVLADRWLLVAGGAGLARATLRVLATDKQAGGLKVVQTLALSGQVASPLLVHEGDVYVATVGGGMEALKIGDDPASPLVPGPRRRPDEGSQTVGWLSLIGGKLWLAGDGVTVFPLPLDEASLAAAAPVVAGQFVWPVVPRGESLLLVDHLADSYGVRVRFVSPAAVSSVSWTLDVGTTLAAGPVIDQPSTTMSVLHRSGALFRTSLDQFNDVAEFVRIPSVGASASELSRVGLQAADEGASVVFDDGLIVFATAHEPDALLVFNPAAPEPRLARWRLPGRLACRPARLGNELLLALERGGVYLVDPRSRELVGEPFGVSFKFDDLPRWTVATTPDATQAIVSDGRNVYRLGLDAAPSPRLALDEITGGHTPGHPRSGSARLHGSAPRPRLVVEAKAELESPIDSPLAATATAVAVADAAGRLVLLELADLKLEAIALDHAVVWGPRACSDRFLVATDAGQLVCFAGARQLAWQVDFPDGPLLSATADGDSLILASRRGVVWAVAAATGDTVWRREIGQPLAGQVVAAKQGIIVGTTDGTLYLLPRLAAGAK